MPTINQKRVFDKVIDKTIKGEKVVIGQIMREEGYKESTSLRPTAMTQSEGWQELLAGINDKSLLEKLYSIAVSTDKRACIAAIKEIFTLKDKYPKQDSKVIGLFEKVGDLQMDDKSKDITGENQLPPASWPTEGTGLPE